MQEFSRLHQNIPLVIDATLGEATQVGSPSYSNVEEALKVRDWVLDLRAAGEDDRDIGVITPYNAQVKLIKNLIGSDEVLVGTVETFQGREKKTVIISTVRSLPSCTLPLGSYRPGFLCDKKRANVALTRCMALEIIVCNPFTLAQVRYL